MKNHFKKREVMKRRKCFSPLLMVPGECAVI